MPRKIQHGGLVSEERLQTIVSLYMGQGKLERVSGDTATAAAEWLDRARDELVGVRALVASGQFRLAFNAAYDIMRHAAESVVTRAGGRIAALPGAHEAVFVLAEALTVGAGLDAFAAARASRIRQTRHGLEYISIDRPTEVDSLDAGQALDWAAEAVDTAAAFLALASPPTI